MASTDSLLELPPDEIHLWFAFGADVENASLENTGLLREYRKLLTEEERAQERRFYFPKHQRQHLITRALVRTVLSRYLPARPETWRFLKNDHGRPSIRTEDNPDGIVSFNLSHTEGLVLCGVARQREIGVDVENVRCREVSLDIADRFFSRKETNALRAIAPERQQECFFRYWTLKESYIKAKGKGLSIPLDQFGFNPPDAPNLRISFDPNWNDTPENWEFWLLRPSVDHLGAVCAQHVEGVRQKLVMRRVVPLVGDSPLDCMLLSESQLAPHER